MVRRILCLFDYSGWVNRKIFAVAYILAYICRSQKLLFALRSIDTERKRSYNQHEVSTNA